MHAMNSGGSRNLRGVWRDLLPAGYCPVSCPRIFCLIMSVQRFRLGFDIAIKSKRSLTKVYSPTYLNYLRFIARHPNIIVIDSSVSALPYKFYKKIF